MCMVYTGGTRACMDGPQLSEVHLGGERAVTGLPTELVRVTHERQ